MLKIFFGVKIILFLFVWQRAKREEQRAKRKTTCSIITAYCQLFVQCSLFVVRCSLFVVRCLLFVVAKSIALRAKRKRYCRLTTGHCLLFQLFVVRYLLLQKAERDVATDRPLPTAYWLLATFCLFSMFKPFYKLVPKVSTILKL